MVGRSSRRSGCGREAIPVVQECSGGPPRDAAVVGMTPGGPGVFVRPSQRSESGREALLEVREWLGVYPGDPGVVGRLSRSYGGGREARSEVRPWSVHPPGGPGVVGRLSRRSGCVRKALQEVWV